MGDNVSSVEIDMAQKMFAYLLVISSLPDDVVTDEVRQQIHVFTDQLLDAMEDKDEAKFYRTYDNFLNWIKQFF